MLLVLFTMFWASPSQAQTLAPPSQSKQLVLAVADTPDSSSVVLQRYERTGPDTPWQKIGTPVPARIGKKGMAWGIGLHGAAPAQARLKQEGDWRAPMGMFSIGKAFGDASSAPSGTTWAYRQVTEDDLWVEDVDAPTYNQHIIVPQARARTPWEEGQRMKMGDAAHALKIVIAHNLTVPAKAGGGSAIFFHIWRSDGARPTSGCTAMARADLETLLRWLSPQSAPVYVLIDAVGRTRAHSAGALP